MKPAEIWQLGDYASVGRRWAEAGRDLARDTVASGDRVLDVACGPGDLAIAAAARGARVTGVDISPTLLDVARARAERDAVTVEWIEHDMTRLPTPDGSFDRVLSAFGCMFAPDPHAMARELRRVCVPGGLVGVLAWSPDSAIGRFGPLTARYLPEAARGPSIDDWGRPERIAGFFAGLGTVSTAVRVVDIMWPSLDEAMRELTDLTPGWVLARTLIAEADWPRLLAEVRELLAASGHTDSGRFVLPTEYLMTRVTTG